MTNTRPRSTRLRSGRGSCREAEEDGQRSFYNSHRRLRYRYFFVLPIFLTVDKQLLCSTFYGYIGLGTLFLVLHISIENVPIFLTLFEIAKNKNEKVSPYDL